MGVNLTTAEVAARLHVAEGTLKNWRSRGGGPVFFKHGRVVFYPLAELEAWEKAHLMKAVSVPK